MKLEIGFKDLNYKSLLIKNAKIYNEDEQKDILIINRKFNKIQKNISYKADKILDLDGFIVTPTFINTHLHIDKAFTINDNRFGKEETLEECIKIMHEIKKNYTVDDVKKRAVRAIMDSVKYGVTKIRAHVDIDNFVNLVALEGCLLAKEETKKFADVQIVAFPQKGIFCNRGTKELMVKAIEMGADIVGGMPYAEWIEEDSKKHVDFVFEVAKKYNLDIDMHVDQTKDFFAKSLEYIAYKTIQENYEGRVSATHCTSLSYQNYAHAQKVMELLKIAKINICVNPQVLLIMGIDQEPRTRGLTRARELVNYGIKCSNSTRYNK